MTIQLGKKQVIELTKSEPGLVHVRVGLGWDASRMGGAFDGDISAAALKKVGTNADGSPVLKLYDEDHFLFYNNKTPASGWARHSGDNRTGVGDGDDETIDIFLGKVPHEVVEIAIVGSIHEGEQRRQNWGALNAQMRLYNGENAKTLAQYNLGTEFPTETAVQFGALIRDGRGDWRLRADGFGFRKGLQDFLDLWQ